MDSDNVVASLKYVRDAVALLLGVDDGCDGPVVWEYDAEPDGPHGVRVELRLG